MMNGLGRWLSLDVGEEGGVVPRAVDAGRVAGGGAVAPCIGHSVDGHGWLTAAILGGVQSPLSVRTPSRGQSLMAEAEAVLKVVALIGAGAFFLWKLFTGWLIVNLKVSIKLERVPMTLDLDHLGISVLFEKGATDSIWLEAVSARVKWPGNRDPKPLDLTEEFRWLTVHNKDIGWDQHTDSFGPIAMSPGEATTVARAAQVPAGHPIEVEVAAYGRRTFWQRGFLWRTSAVSLPVPRPVPIKN